MHFQIISTILLLCLSALTLALPPAERDGVGTANFNGAVSDDATDAEMAADAAQQSITNQEINWYQAAMYNMTLDDFGFVQMGNDGVVRSWDGDGKVIDYVRLNNRQVIHSFHYFGRHSKRDDEDFVLRYLRYVNGHDVPSHQIYTPPEAITPPEFRPGYTRSDDGLPSPPAITAGPEPRMLEIALVKRAKTTSILTITTPIPSSWPDCIGCPCHERARCLIMGWDCWACLQVHGPSFPKTCVHMDYPYGIGPSPYYGPIVITGGRVSGGKRDVEEGEQEDDVPA